MDQNSYVLGVKKKLKKNSKLFSNREKVRYLLSRNNGYITTKEISKNRIARDYLMWMTDYGEIINVARGIYIDRKIKEDIYYTLQLRFPKIIFSHLTALYLNGLINKKDEINFTCINNVFSNDFKKYNTFYVKEEWYEIGLIEIIDKQGFPLKCYDLERTICDIIRSYKRFDIKDIKRYVNKYLSLENKNIDNLFIYAERMGIYADIVKFSNIKTTSKKDQ